MGFIYDFFYIIAFILYFPFLLVKGKIHSKFFSRFGSLKNTLNMDPKNKGNIWIHAVSVGEVIAVTNLIKMINEKYPQNNIILSTVTTTGYKIANEIARRRIPVIVGPISTSFVDMPKLEYRNHDIRNATILSKKGVQLALGVSGRDGVSSKFVTLAAAMAVANDLDRDVALRAVTLTPAEILGVANRIGSLEPDKDADIIILSGHPLDTFTQVEMVLIEGETVYERKATQ